MKRPERINLSGFSKGHGYGSEEHVQGVIHNTVIDNYEAYIDKLADVERIEKLIWRSSSWPSSMTLAGVKEISKAISEYISGRGDGQG